MAEQGLNFGGYVLLFALALAGLVLFGVVRKWASARVTIYDHEQALKLRAGVIQGVVGPGRYPTWPDAIEFVRLDMRSQTASLSGQEILTADSLSVKVSANIEYRIGDPLAYRRGAQFPEQRLYEAAQTALRRKVSTETLDAILADRGVIERGLKEAVAAEVGAIGLVIDAASVRDLTLSGPAKQALADLWKADKEGQAALTRARGEQASLRSLANAARLLKGNPELMNLRILQAAAGKPGAPAPTIVLGGAGGLLPVAQGGMDASADDVAGD
jgi:regulator of protease activity HflC (stomatin/prohibitin superfamily)